MRSRKSKIAPVQVHRIVIMLLLCFVSFAFLYPFLAMISTSLKSGLEAFSNISLIPSKVMWRNYIDVWKESNFLQFYQNTIIVAAFSTVLTVLFSSLAAYAFARMSFRGKNILYYLLFSALLLPPHAVIIPISRITMKLNLLNTYAGLIGPYVAFGVPFCSFILRNYLEVLPLEIEESAKIDGCSSFRIYWNIVIPLMRPALITVIIWQLIFSWNEFMFALLLMIELKMRTLPLVSLFYKGSYGYSAWGKLFAVFTLMIVPLMIVFVSLQRHFVKGLTAGAIK